MKLFNLKGKSLLLLALTLAILLAARFGFSERRRVQSLFSKAAERPATRMAGLPRVILWAWERPERLDFINPEEVGVAFLAKTLYLRGERVAVRPRLQPLEVPQGTKLIAVARLEADRLDQPRLTEAQITRAASEIAELAQLPRVLAVQVDFDARQTERDFYRRLLVELRGRLPDRVALSMTALASWCISDDWIKSLPVDEAVPMLFRMGIDRRQILSHLEAGNGFGPALCRSGSGISTDETVKHLPSSPRLYVFNPEAWSRASVSKIILRYKNENEDF
ncbi:MAG TPA: hypothetical protein VGB17_19645 [Pyrinomonadaceae bacterium]|jgi:hypothetical protein